MADPTDVFMIVFNPQTARLDRVYLLNDSFTEHPQLAQYVYRKEPTIQSGTEVLIDTMPPAQGPFPGEDTTIGPPDESDPTPSGPTPDTPDGSQRGLLIADSTQEEIDAVRARFGASVLGRH